MSTCQSEIWKFWAATDFDNIDIHKKSNCMRCNRNYVSSLKNPSFTKTFPIARDCRYGEVCNGQQRCEVGSGSSVSIQEDLSARFFEEALRRSRRVKRDIDGWQGWQSLLFLWPRNEIWYNFLLSVWYPRKNTCYPISWQTENDPFRKYDSQFVSIVFQFISFCNEIWKKKFSICESCGAAKRILAYQTSRGPLGAETDYNFAHS